MGILKKISVAFYFVMGVIFLFSFQANAGIVIYGTRIVYSADKKQVSIKTENTSDLPVLLQISIDAGDLMENARESTVPFFITPPLARIEAKSGQIFRIINTDLGESLPKDRETLFYFNLLEVPSLPTVAGGDSENYVQLGFMSRLKLFYRPTEILGKVADAKKSMKWAVNSNSLKISNPSGYYVSFRDIFIKKSDVVYSVDFQMMEPMSEVVLDLDKVAKVVDSLGMKISKDISDNSVYFYYLNDDGTVSDFQAELLGES